MLPETVDRGARRQPDRGDLHADLLRLRRAGDRLAPADCEAKLLITADGFLRRGAVGRPEVGRRRGGCLGADRRAGDRRAVARATPSTCRGPTVATCAGATRPPKPTQAGEPDKPAERDPETPYMIIYTSGTTGRPKGAVHVHGGFPIKAAQDLAHTFDLTARRRPVLVHRPRLDDGSVGDRRGAAARRPARPLRRRAGLPGAGPAVVDRRAPPGHAPRPLADRRSAR